MTSVNLLQPMGPSGVLMAGGSEHRKRFLHSIRFLG